MIIISERFHLRVEKSKKKGQIEVVKSIQTQDFSFRFLIKRRGILNAIIEKGIAYCAL
jgi:hypothetical protein